MFSSSMMSQRSTPGYLLQFPVVRLSMEGVRYSETHSDRLAWCRGWVNGTFID
jgi:hypothetical protein